MKNVLIISSSPRKNGNSETLAKEFMKGATEAGHNVELIRLNDYKINYCQSCWCCKSQGKCVQNDDLNMIADKLKKADVVLLATPTYFYNMSGQLKVFLDRLCTIYTSLHFDVYIFITANDSDPAKLEHVVECVRGFSRDCLENSPEKGVIKCGDDDPEPFLIKAYNYGLHC